MDKVLDGGTFKTEESQERIVCPQLATAKDVIDRIGVLSVEILNKDKVIGKLWENIDTISNEVTSLKEIENNIALKDKAIEELLTKKAKVRENQISVEKNYRESLQRLKDEHQIRINTKDGEIEGLEKTLKSIEAEAVVNQEEIRKELMETQNELLSLKESLKSPKKVTKKKKTNAKPARA